MLCMFYHNMLIYLLILKKPQWYSHTFRIQDTVLIMVLSPGTASMYFYSHLSSLHYRVSQICPATFHQRSFPHNAPGFWNIATSAVLNTICSLVASTNSTSIITTSRKLFLSTHSRLNLSMTHSLPTMSFSFVVLVRDVIVSSWV